MANAIGRRAFFATVLGVPMTGLSIPTAGFSLSGHMTNAGQETERYYAIAQGCCLMLDPQKLPACVAGADQLLEGEVELTLTRKYSSV